MDILNTYGEAWVKINLFVGKGNRVETFLFHYFRESYAQIPVV